MPEYYRDLAEQLAAMPGGHARLREEYFGSVTLPGPIPAEAVSSGEIVEGWPLKGEGALILARSGNGDAALTWLRKDGEVALAVYSGELWQAAHEFAVAPLGLALLALAMGGVDDSRLRNELPELHKATKSLLLIAVCRLCG